MVHQNSTVTAYRLRNEDMVRGFCRGVNLDVCHLYGGATDGRHPTEGIARSTRMVQRGKTFERGLQAGHHIQIGTKASCGDNHSLCRKRIGGAIGILHLYARHAAIDRSEQARV